MRTLLFLGLAIGAAFMANWFTIERDGDHTRIEINKDEIRTDAQRAIDKGREIIDKREHGQQTNAPLSGDRGPGERLWQRSTPAQATGYTNQGAYGNQPGYGGQNQGGQNYDGQNYGGQNYDGQNYGGQNQGGQPSGGQPYGNQTAPSGNAPTYPASTRNPPPWQR